MNEIIKEINDGVTSIYLNNKTLSDEDFNKLSIVLSTNNTLTSINLSGNNIGDKVVLNIYQMLYLLIIH
jgi:hypothetical protein